MKARTVIGVALLCAVVGCGSWCAARCTLFPRKPSLPTLEFIASGTGKTLAWTGPAPQGSVVVESKELFSNQDAERARKMIQSGRVLSVEPTLIQVADARLSGSETGA